MKSVFPLFRTGALEDAEAVSDQFGLACEDESMADQSQAEEADINTIVRRFGVTGQVSVVPMPPALDAFAEVFDYQSAQNLLIAARNSFNSLDAEVRDRFKNDPAAFVDFASNPDNLDEMREMGLAVPLKVKETTLDDVVNTLKETRYGDDGPLDSDARAPSEASARGAGPDRGRAPGGSPGGSAGGFGPGGQRRR